MGTKEALACLFLSIEERMFSLRMRLLCRIDGSYNTLLCLSFLFTSSCED